MTTITTEIHRLAVVEATSGILSTDRPRLSRTPLAPLRNATAADGEFLNFVVPRRYWLTLIPFAAFLNFSDFVVHRPLVMLTHWALAAGATENGAMAEQSAAPLRLLIAVGVFAAGAGFLWLAMPVQRVLVGAEKALAIVAVTWLLLRVLDVQRHLRAAEKSCRTQQSLGQLGQQVTQRAGQQRDGESVLRALDNDVRRDGLHYSS